VTTRDPALHERIKLTDMRLGMGVGATTPNWCCARVSSIGLRYRRTMPPRARWRPGWPGRPEISRVLHPALAGSPGRRTLADPLPGRRRPVLGDVRPRHGSAQVDRFVDALRLFRIGYSWAARRAWSWPYDLASMRAAAPYPARCALLVGWSRWPTCRPTWKQALSVL